MINKTILKLTGYKVEDLMGAYQSETGKKIELTETSMEDFVKWVKKEIPEALARKKIKKYKIDYARLMLILWGDGYCKLCARERERCENEPCQDVERIEELKK